MQEGLELKYEFSSGSFFAGMNYTLQFTRGNADNPILVLPVAGF